MACCAAGDVLFLAGITMTIGVRRTFVFFFKRKQVRGNLFFFAGIVLVFCKWAVIGMVLQVRTTINKPTTAVHSGLVCTTKARRMTAVVEKRVSSSTDILSDPTLMRVVPTLPPPFSSLSLGC